MARTPTITAEYVTAGDPYTLVLKVAGIASEWVFTAQARARRGATGDPLAEFTVDAQDGTGDDDGFIVVSLSLDGDTTAELPRFVYCDVQREPAAGGDPLTLLRWELVVEPDVTR